MYFAHHFCCGKNITSSDKGICLVSKTYSLSSQHKIKHKEFSLQRQTFALTIGLSWQIILHFLLAFISQSALAECQTEKEARHLEDTKTTAPT